MKNLLMLFIYIISCGAMYASDLSWTAPVTLSSVPTNNSSNPQAVMDINNNATVIWIENTFINASTLPSGGSWSSPVVLSIANATNPQLVVDPFGSVTAVWIQNDQVVTSTYASGMWSMTPTILSSTGASSPSLAVDSAGNLAAAWVRSGNVETAIQLFGSSWPMSPQVITASGAIDPQIVLGGTGSTTTSIVVWHAPAVSTFNTVYAARARTGMSWGSTTTISDVTRNAAYPQVAVDPNGNGLAMWYSYDVDITGTLFSGAATSSATLPFGGSWTTAIVVSTPGIRNPQDLQIELAFDPSGNAVAMWTMSYEDQVFNLESSVLPAGGNWGIPNFLSSTHYSYAFDLQADTFGNAYAAYMQSFDGVNFPISTIGTFVAAEFAETWSNTDIISTATINGFPSIGLAYLTAGVSPLGVPANGAVAAWVSYNGTNNVVQVATGVGAIVLPPTSLAVTQSANSFQLFTEYVNNFTWVDSTSPFISEYLIFRNGKFLAEISPGVMLYEDDNRHQTEPATYEIATLDDQGMQSQVASVNYP